MALPRVLINSVPKAGTHLLQRCLRALPGLVDTQVHVDIARSDDSVRAGLLRLPPGGVATGHLVHEARYVTLLREVGVVQLLMVRDPRDVVVSYAEYVLRLRSHYLHEHFVRLDPPARLLAAIRGVPGTVPWDTVALRDIGSVFAQFLPWRDQPGTLLVRFEDLVGPLGGGDAGRQRACVLAIVVHLGLVLDEAALDAAVAAVFDPTSPTFRRGGIGEWRERFTSQHREAFEEVAGTLLEELGYERVPVAR